MAKARTTAGAIALALVLDCVSVFFFIVTGRGTNEDALGVLHAAWPFLVGLAIGWAISRVWRSPRTVLWTGLIIWASTSAIGMTLRAITVAPMSATYVFLSSVAIAAFMLGWRAAAWVILVIFETRRERVVDEKYRR